MITNPILPIWLVAILCVILLVFKRKGVLPYIRQIIMVLLIFLINLRILIPTKEVQSQVQDRDLNVLFVVDDTISMIAKDYDGDMERLTAVFQDCDNLIDQLYGARFSVISFHNEAQVMAPYTNDAEFIKSVIHSIYPISPIWAKGSSLNSCRELMQQSLERAKKKGDGKVILFFISDGEITNGEKLKSFGEMQKFVDGGAVLGYGTREGGKMYFKYRYSGEVTVIQDITGYDYGDAISRIDETNLNSIASDIGIRYINMNDKNGLDEEIDSINNSAIVSEDDKVTAGFVETYYVFTILLVVVLICDFVCMRRR